MTLKEALKLYEGQKGVKEIKSLIKKGINARYLTDGKEDKILCKICVRFILRRDSVIKRLSRL